MGGGKKKFTLAPHLSYATTKKKREEKIKKKKKKKKKKKSSPPSRRGMANEKTKDGTNLKGGQCKRRPGKRVFGKPFGGGGGGETTREKIGKKMDRRGVQKMRN